MKCSNCGQEGHNRRTCQALYLENNLPRDRALILRLDNMTEDEQNRMHSEIVKLKKKETSDNVIATLVEGKSSELPSKIKAIHSSIEDQCDE